MTCSTPGCRRPVRARGICHPCYQRAWRSGTLPGVRTPRVAPNRRPPDTLDDLRDLDEAHVGANEAAVRLGFPTAEALERWLYRKDERALWKRLKNRDPLGVHSSRQRAMRRHESEAS